MSDNRNSVLRNQYAIPFAAWELRLYLNTHPTDRRALRLYYHLIRQCPYGNYASIHLDRPCNYLGMQDNALEMIDNAACNCTTNIDDMLASCGCADELGDCNDSCCAIRWEWLDDAWPWDGVCGNTTCAG